MENIQILEISTTDPISGMNALYFPQLLVGGSEVPSEGTMLFQMEENDEVTYTTEKVILAPTYQQELVVISREMEVVRKALKGVMVETEKKPNPSGFLQETRWRSPILCVGSGNNRPSSSSKKGIEKSFFAFPGVGKPVRSIGCHSNFLWRYESPSYSGSSFV